MGDLNAHLKMKAKEELHNFRQNTDVADERATLKGTKGMASLRGSVRCNRIVVPSSQ